MSPRPTPRPKTAASSVESIQLFTQGRDTDQSLLDLIDNLLNNGVVLYGDLILGVANVDLIYAQLSVLLSAVDRVRDPAGSRRMTGKVKKRQKAKGRR